jgi:hypothetical protein
MKVVPEFEVALVYSKISLKIVNVVAISNVITIINVVSFSESSQFVEFLVAM